eukprot:3975804-Pleurochrysis_carterae.AAC.2
MEVIPRTSFEKASISRTRGAEDTCAAAATGCSPPLASKAPRYGSSQHLIWEYRIVNSRRV